MLKYFFTTATTSMSNAAYRKVLIWRNVVLIPAVLFGLVLGYLPVHSKHGDYYTGLVAGMVGGFVAISIFVVIRIQQIRHQSDGQIRQRLIQETDERLQYNKLRALKFSYILLMIALYVPFYYFATHQLIFEALMMIVIYMGSLASYCIAYVLFNRYQ